MRPGYTACWFWHRPGWNDFNEAGAHAPRILPVDTGFLRNSLMVTSMRPGRMRPGYYV